MSTGSAHAQKIMWRCRFVISYLMRYKICGKARALWTSDIVTACDRVPNFKRVSAEISCIEWLLIPYLKFDKLSCAAVTNETANDWSQLVPAHETYRYYKDPQQALLKSTSTTTSQPDLSITENHWSQLVQAQETHRFAKAPFKHISKQTKSNQIPTMRYFLFLTILALVALAVSATASPDPVPKGPGGGGRGGGGTKKKKTNSVVGGGSTSAAHGNWAPNGRMIAGIGLSAVAVGLCGF
ncbi:hypothetical protein EDC01DRAFT_627049 [Geopyxis carbonaria]|nr:hypothetical protein EDC01DRAFT_627049 [Geopyxis carbonaria]